MERTVSLSCGERTYTVAIPQGVALQIAEPRAVTPAADPGAAVREALDHPIGSPRLEELVRPGQKVCLICDDNTRPTPAGLILKELLPRLEGAGITDRDILIVFALGSHRAMTPSEMAEKIGADILSRYRAVNSEFQDEDKLVTVGKSQLGTPIRVFREAMEADVRVAIGNIVPHSCMGWAGGAKMLYPGITSEDIVSEFHAMQGLQDEILFGMEDCSIRLAVEEWTEQIGLHFILNTVLTPEGRLYRAVAGHYVKAHRAGVAYAKDVFCAVIDKRPDVALISSKPIVLDLWQSGKALSGSANVMRPGGTILLLSPCPEGLGPHPDAFRHYAAPKEALREKIARGETGEPLLAMAVGMTQGTILRKCGVTHISDGLSAQLLEGSGCRWRPERELQAALDQALSQYEHPTLMVVPVGGETIPLLKEQA